MAYKILVPTFDYSGNEYPTDVYGEYQSRDVNLNRLDDLNITGRVSFWKTQQFKENGFQKIQLIISLTDKTDVGCWNKTLTEEQADTLNPSMVADFVLEYLESIYGKGNVVVV